MGKRKSLYSPHPAVAMLQKWTAELPNKTGRSLEEWLTLIAEEGPAGEVERRDWLKKKYHLGTNYAIWMAKQSVGKEVEFNDPDRYLQTAEQYVENMFGGKKAGLRPIYNALLKYGLGFADDVKACPCTTIVPLYRNHVIAQIKPTTLTRIDMGFALKNAKATGRLIDTGGFAKKDRITHRIPITSVDEIDDEVKHWFAAAYELDE